VRKQIVHNKHVVATLEARGAIFVDQTDEVPEGKIVVFSAHGVSPAVHAEAADRNLKTIDATCPLVTKVHHEARRFAAEELEILFIGHEGHEEVEGTMGEAVGKVKLVDGLDSARTVQPTPGKKLAWLSQTTLSVDEALQSVAKGSLDLGELDNEADKAAQAAAETAAKPLLEKIQATLGDKIEMVRPSTRLTDSPACLVVGDNAMGYGGPHPSGRSIKELMLEELQGQLDIDRIHFLGRIPHASLIALLQLSWVHVYLSYPFILGWSLLEAMACGCCIVGSQGMPVEEVIHNGVEGMLVPMDNPQKLAKRVLSLLADAPLRQQLGATARAAAIEWDQNKTLPLQAAVIEGI
jgi:hypothetical protein